MVNLKPVLHAVLEDYALPWQGDHGIAHWARMLENGLRVAENSGADMEVVSLFAVLHDSRRLNEGYDPEHGPRAARFAKKLRGRVYELSDDAFKLLFAACQGHTHERTHANITVQACYDSDRLDLGRVGILPDPKYLSTDFAKLPEIIKWADGRASFGVIPSLVQEDWEIDLTSGT